MNPPITQITETASFDDGAKLLRRAEGLYQHHFILEPGLPLLLPVWNFHTFMYEEFSHTPYLDINSPVKGCAKTTLSAAILQVSKNGMLVVNPTGPSIFRTIDQDRPTLIIDEAALHRDSSLLTIANAGFSRMSGVIPRVFKDRVRKFNIFCPKAFASLNLLPETVMDRSIRIQMKGLRREDRDKIVPFSEKSVPEDLVAGIATWVTAHRNEIVRHYDRCRLDFLHARQEDIWRPLFSIIHILSPEREEEFRAIAIRLTAQKKENEEDRRIRLLQDVRVVFRDNNRMSAENRMSTIDLLSRLAAMPESPWSNLNAFQLATLLRRFGIKPKQLWIGAANVRGYALEDFEDAFARYTTEPDSSQIEIAPGGNPAGTDRSEEQHRETPQTDSARTARAIRSTSVSSISNGKFGSALSVLSYPGKKQWLVPRAQDFVLRTRRPELFAEPCAGSGVVSLSLLNMNLVDTVVLSDDDERICQFWERAIHDPSLAEEVLAFQCTRENVEALCANPEANIALWVIVKTHVSFGGHLDQGGLRSEKNIDQRWYPKALSQRLAMVRALAPRIVIHHMKAVECLRKYSHENYSAYIDAPYPGLGKDLYLKSDMNHEELFGTLATWPGNWFATYSNDALVGALCHQYGFHYERLLMRNAHHAQKTELVIGRDLDWLKNKPASVGL
jgi:DNA adenine methylase